MKKKFLYVMRDPFKKGGVKIGITSFRSAKVRLGNYQNSFPGKSHLATFDKLWYGTPNAVNSIEKVLKNQFGYAIELDGRGFTEWVYEDEQVIVDRIKELIDGYKFHVYPVKTEGETVYTIEDLIEELINKEAG